MARAEVGWRCEGGWDISAVLHSRESSLIF